MPNIKILKDETIFDGKYLQVIKRNYLNRKINKYSFWEMIQRKGSGRVVVGLVGITPNQEIILEKTYRIPLKSYIIEPCLGLMDIKGESQIQAARREFLEETGYKAEKIKKIYQGPANPGLINDELAIYLGFNAVKIKESKLEDSEDIKVIKIPLNKLKNYLFHPPKNTILDIKLFSLLPFLPI